MQDATFVVFRPQNSVGYFGCQDGAVSFIFHAALHIDTLHAAFCVPRTAYLTHPCFPRHGYARPASHLFVFRFSQSHLAHAHFGLFPVLLRPYRLARAHVNVASVVVRGFATRRTSR